MQNLQTRHVLESCKIKWDSHATWQASKNYTGWGGGDGDGGGIVRSVSTLMLPGQDNNLLQEPVHSRRPGSGTDLCQNEHQV